ncbi:hypothetical protein M8C21_013074 [Ambrosia artemisiifolia]|uniref:Uncharacterized protein n=1 Tax=Ambrosia artemisiifolia TaxID=4212 RepID=A0AAD5G9S5_AMBAR|nr:hypothetical protein M8C21_013074 [Ambrosia artemisiifolia]
MVDTLMERVKDGNAGNFHYSIYDQFIQFIQRVIEETHCLEKLWNLCSPMLMVHQSSWCVLGLGSEVYESGGGVAGGSILLGCAEGKLEHQGPQIALDLLYRPRVCILGGGFGGLYTTLRLESLTWPEDKKPQVLKDLAFWDIMVFKLGCFESNDQ